MLPCTTRPVGCYYRRIHWPSTLSCYNYIIGHYKDVKDYDIIRNIIFSSQVRLIQSTFEKHGIDVPEHLFHAFFDFFYPIYSGIGVLVPVHLCFFRKVHLLFALMFHIHVQTESRTLMYLVLYIYLTSF